MSPACIAQFLGFAICFSRSSFAAAIPDKPTANARPAIPVAIRALRIFPPHSIMVDKQKQTVLPAFLVACLRPATGDSFALRSQDVNLIRTAANYLLGISD